MNIVDSHSEIFKSSLLTTRAVKYSYLLYTSHIDRYQLKKYRGDREQKCKEKIYDQCASDHQGFLALTKVFSPNLTLTLSLASP